MVSKDCDTTGHPQVPLFRVESRFPTSTFVGTRTRNFLLSDAGSRVHPSLTRVLRRCRFFVPHVCGSELSEDCSGKLLG